MVTRRARDREIRRRVEQLPQARDVAFAHEIDGALELSGELAATRGEQLWKILYVSSARKHRILELRIGQRGFGGARETRTEFRYQLRVGFREGRLTRRQIVVVGDIGRGAVRDQELDGGQV